MRHLLHLVNVFNARLDVSAFVAQPATLESMREAKRFAAPHVNVTLATVQAAGDDVLVPPGFERLPDLERDVTDIGAFATPLRLPLLADLLDRAVDAATAADAEFIVFTNTDIAVQPGFYRYLDDMIDHGYDALIINRRTLRRGYAAVADLTRAWAEGGGRHSGLDCFVFRTEAARTFFAGDVCTGAVGVGSALAVNIACYAQRFRWVKDAHMTLHWGHDRTWAEPERDEYGRHNKRASLAVYKAMPNRERLPELGILHQQLDEGRLATSPKASRAALNARRVERVTLGLQRLKHRVLQRARRSRQVLTDLPPVHGLAELERIRADDVFITAFPGSGTPALRRLLGHLLYPEATLGSADIRRRMPAAGERPTHLEAMPGRRFITDFGATFHLAPKTIYLCRDPRTALAAYRADQSEAATVMSDWLRSSDSVGPVAHGGPGLSWAQHVRAALAFAADTPDRMLWVSWQSMCDQPAKTLAGIAGFCGLPVSDEMLQAAVAQWTGPDPNPAPIKDPDDLRYLGVWAGPMMRVLGYSP